jgi:hypothetical protein
VDIQNGHILARRSELEIVVDINLGIQSTISKKKHPNIDIRDNKRLTSYDTRCMPEG